MIKSGSKRTLVGNISGQFTLVLSGSLSDISTVIENTILWGISLSLKSSEEGFLGSQNLDCRSWVLDQVGETSTVRDKFSSNGFSDEGGQVWGDSHHLVLEILSNISSEFKLLQYSGSQFKEGSEIQLGEFLSHTRFSSIEDLLSKFSFFDDLFDLRKTLVLEVNLISELLEELNVDFVFSDNLGQLGEMPSVPFLYSHGKGVEVLVELFENGDTLDDWFILSVDIEADSVSGPAVSKTQLGSDEVIVLEILLLQVLMEVSSDSSEQFENDVRDLALKSQL